MGDRRKVRAIDSTRTRRVMILHSGVAAYFRRLANDISRQFLEFGKEGVVSAITNAENTLEDLLLAASQETVNDIGNQQLEIIVRRIKKQFQVDFANQLAFFLASRALRTKLIVGSTNRAEAAVIISNGFAAGLTNPEIAKALKANFSSLQTAYKVNRIARTETSIVAAEAQSRSVKESGVDVVKEWVAINDERTRGRAKPGEPAPLFNHTNVGGPDEQIIEMDALFDVGIDKMKGPHDLSASAGNIINCRCVLNLIPRAAL